VEAVTPAGADGVAPDTVAAGDQTQPGASPSSSSRRRDWLARALFEGALILFGLLAAFALNQWHEARQRAARADAMIVAIRAELGSNLELQGQAAAHNAEIVELLKKLRGAGETFLPADRFKGGLFSRPHLTEAAWMSAQNGGILQELPVETILVLAKVYETQRDYQDSTRTLFEGLYGVALNSTEFRSDGFERVPQLAAVLNDFALNGTRLARDYRQVLDYLNANYPGLWPTASPEEPPAATADPANQEQPE
jgi:hypothetical protein